MTQGMNVDRRTFLAAAGGLAVATSLRPARAAERPQTSEPVPMIHVTDLFRPHDDPDDHWDLACVYALAYTGRVDLQGILIDSPKPQRRNDPDVLAVAQMNHLTGTAVPVAVGSPKPFGTQADEQHLLGIRSMLRWMRDSKQPVVINILGACRDVAIAAQLEPDLFATKCKAVYLNAGSGTPDPAEATRQEWNVRLDPGSYAAMFALPCPVYWMPCFQAVHPKPDKLFQVGEYGTFYRFRQEDVLPQLSERVQRFFAFMFREGRLVPKSLRATSVSIEWLRALDAAPEPELMDCIQAMNRNMWCTGGFLHAVGQTVTCDGQIVAIADAKDSVFTFDSVDVSCSPDAITRWKPAPSPTNRFLFHVRDRSRYSAAMTNALRSLLKQLA